MTGLMTALVGGKDMIMFSSMSFIFCFLPLFFIVYYVVPGEYKNIVMLLGSIIFYALGEPFFVLLLLAAVGMNYLFATFVWNDGNQHIWKRKQRKQYLTMVLLLDVGMLAGFKALHLYESSFLLPVGVSFFTFKMISYQVDAYRGMIEKPDFVKTATYFTLFPQVTSGPVMRYGEAAGVLNKPACDAESLEDGWKYFVLGLSAKVLLADKLSLLWNELQSIGFESISTPLAWLGAVAYSLNLYFDFAGYSLMAAGLCRMMGYPFIKNFDHPYASKSMREFWRRWHITLGTWFRDYVYIPLGGNRSRQWRTLLNLLIVWLLTGIWHGAGWNFLLWGLILFCLIAMEKLFLGAWLERSAVLAHGYVLFLMPLTWMVFAITDLKQLSLYFTRLFPFFGASAAGANPHDFTKFTGLYAGLLAAAMICCLPAVTRLYEKYKKRWLVTAGLTVLFWIAVYAAVNSANNPFLYFDF